MKIIISLIYLNFLFDFYYYYIYIIILLYIS